jgi:hypothetical protein
LICILLIEVQNISFFIGVKIILSVSSSSSSSCCHHAFFLLDNMNEIKQLTGIYHETQEGSLCAQHALNNLLQREIFSAVSLADIAR